MVYELPTRSTGDASHATRAAISEMTVRADAVDLVARIPQGADSKPAKRQEQKDHGSLADPKTDAAASKTSEAEQRELEELREMDRRVRAHEQAHMSAGGGLVRGGPTYQYKTRPDGQRYAVGGEVQLDTSPVTGNPLATKRKAERIRRAALAPADPSPEDRHLAAQAEAMANRASQEQVQAKLGTGPKTDGAPVALSPDAMPQDRPAAVNPETKKGSSASQEEPAPMDKPASELAAASSDPRASAEPALPFDPTPHLGTAFAGQGLPAVSAYRKPSSPATRAWLNILV
ncbi:MAG: putative metalloprotease CJM1_0395 family protein [Chloroflexota bacterium]|nr:putative metalloprotease CJM1_0395 family protein [Chloroflexota bacterium]